MANQRRVAVLLNRRAQGVTRAVVRWFEARVAREDLYVAASVDEGRAAVRAIVAAGHDVLVPGGGDGTFMECAAELVRLAPPAMPALLPLRLGTGNAVHDVCGSSPPGPAGWARDLARAADPDEVPSPLRLLDVDGRLTQFAGVGLDADWAADYAWLVKRHVGNGPLLPLVRGAPGYLATALGLTIPRLVLRPHVELTLTALGAAAALDDDGRDVAHHADGAVLFAGPATLAAASTVPSYSAGFRFFPHVDRIGPRFEIRVGAGGLRDVVGQARRLLLGGDQRAPGLLRAFAARGLRVELARARRYHVGGDVLAPTRGFTIRLAPRPVPIVRPRSSVRP